MPTKLVSIGYPLMDVLVLGLLVRLMIASGRRAVGFALLVLGFAALLITDSIDGWLLLHAISKTIVEAHGGTITATSRLGVGTSMTIDLPAGR